MIKNIPFLLFCLLSLLSTLSAQNAEIAKVDDFYQWDKIQDIHVNFQEENWNELLDSMRLYGNTMLTADVTIGDKTYNGAGVRYRESRSFQINQMRNALHIELDFSIRNQNHQGYSNIILSNALRDPSMMREVLAFEIAGKYMHAPQANFANVKVNGKDYGFFVNIEAVDEPFLQKRFDADDNTLIKASPAIGQTTNSSCKKNVFSGLDVEGDMSCYKANYLVTPEDGWDDLVELIETLNNNTENIEEILDVDQVLWMHAFNSVILNLSSYSGQHSNNYYLYKDDFGFFHPIVWDLNLAFGSFKNIGTGSDLSIGELQKLDPVLHHDNSLKPLISKLLNVPTFRKIYFAHIRTIINDNFKNNQFENRVKEIKELITPYVNQDKNKSYTNEEFSKSLTEITGQRSRIPALLSLMQNRISFLTNLNELEVIPPQITDIEVFHRPKYSNKKVETFKFTARVSKMPESVALFYRFHENQPWQMKIMEKDGTIAGDDKETVFLLEIDPEGLSEDIQFYFRTMNAGAADYFPSNYMFIPFEANLKELNQ